MIMNYHDHVSSRSIMIHYERLMIHYEHLMIHCERLKSGQEGPQAVLFFVFFFVLFFVFVFLFFFCFCLFFVCFWSLMDSVLELTSIVPRIALLLLRLFAVRHAPKICVIVTNCALARAPIVRLICLNRRAFCAALRLVLAICPRRAVVRTLRAQTT